MRRTMWILVAVVAVLAGVAIGVSAYHAGVTHGLTQSGHATQVVRVVGPGAGFFPFGLFLFPLFLFLVFAVARGVFWRRRWYGPDAPAGGRGWDDSHRDAFEDWHRRQHEGSGSDRPRGPDQGATV